MPSRPLTWFTRSTWLLVFVTLFILGLSGTSTAFESNYLTTFAFGGTSATNVRENRIEVSWSTNQTSGSIIERDLTDLQVQLFNFEDLLYTDTIITSGVIQPLSTLDRVGVNDNGGVIAAADSNTATLVFSFDIDAFNDPTQTAQFNLDNNANSVIESVAGLDPNSLVYNFFLFSPGGGVNADRFVGGVEDLSGNVFAADTGAGFSFSTELVSTSVPEPSSAALWLSIATVATLRRTRRLL